MVKCKNGCPYELKYHEECKRRTMMDNMPMTIWAPPIALEKYTMRISHKDVQYTNTETLIAELEDLHDTVNDSSYADAYNTGIDAAIKKVREHDKE